MCLHIFCSFCSQRSSYTLHFNEAKKSTAGCAQVFFIYFKALKRWQYRLNTLTLSAWKQLVWSGFVVYFKILGPPQIDHSVHFLNHIDWKPCKSWLTMNPKWKWNFIQYLGLIKKDLAAEITPFCNFGSGSYINHYFFLFKSKQIIQWMPFKSQTKC